MPFWKKYASATAGGAPPWKKNRERYYRRGRGPASLEKFAGATAGVENVAKCCQDDFFMVFFGDVSGFRIGVFCSNRTCATNSKS